MQIVHSNVSHLNAFFTCFSLNAFNLNAFNLLSSCSVIFSFQYCKVTLIQNTLNYKFIQVQFQVQTHFKDKTIFTSRIKLFSKVLHKLLPQNVSIICQDPLSVKETINGSLYRRSIRFGAKFVGDRDVFKLLSLMIFCVLMLMLL